MPGTLFGHLWEKIIKEKESLYPRRNFCGTLKREPYFIHKFSILEYSCNVQRGEPFPITVS